MPAELDVSDLLVGESDAIRLDHLRSEGLYDADGLQWVIGQAQELIHDDPRASETLCRVLDRAAAELELADIRAEVRYLQARIVTERGDLDHGLLLIGQAREEWLRAGQPTAALRTELGRMQILDDLGRHGDALDVGQQLVAEVEAIEPEADDYPLARAIRAHAIDNIGTAYGLLGSHEQALQAYAQAEAEYAELGLVLDAARPQANRGVELLALGRAREALLELDAAVAGFTRAGDRIYAAKCQGFQAQAHELLGRWVEALDVLSRARRTLEELDASTEALRLQLAMAEIYLTVGLWTEARHEATEAVERTIAGGLVHDAGVACYLLGSAELGRTMRESGERRAEPRGRPVRPGRRSAVRRPHPADAGRGRGADRPRHRSQNARRTGRGRAGRGRLAGPARADPFPAGRSGCDAGTSRDPAAVRRRARRAARAAAAALPPPDLPGTAGSRRRPARRGGVPAPRRDR